MKQKQKIMRKFIICCTFFYLSIIIRDIEFGDNLLAQPAATMPLFCVNDFAFKLAAPNRQKKISYTQNYPHSPHSLLNVCATNMRLINGQCFSTGLKSIDDNVTSSTTLLGNRDSKRKKKVIKSTAS